MTQQRTQQHIFAAALLDPALPCPPGLIAWNGSDPARRFAVHRNNVIVSLVDALADSFAVTQALVGEEFFRAMARVFALAQPPRARCLAFYGDAFPDFIASFPPVAGVPYLADVARLEMLRIRAYHAADAAPVATAEFAAALADQAALPALCLAMHPSLATLHSDFAVLSLWAAHQGVLELSAVVPDAPESALILRNGLDVEAIEIPFAAAVFIEALRACAPLGAAAQAAASVEAGFDPTDALRLLIQKGAVTALHFPRRTP